MPLLRLLHQITNMYQNVKEAQNEFRQQPDVCKKFNAKDEYSLGMRIVGEHEERTQLFMYFYLIFTASEPNDLLHFGSASDRFNTAHDNLNEEQYDKFNETLTINTGSGTGR